MPSEEKIWWNSTTPNQPVSPIIFDRIFKKVQNYMKGKDDIYVFDGYCGTSRKSSKNIRIVTEYAWQHHYVTNMFIRPEEHELKGFEPDFTIINCSKGLTNDEWREMGLNSELFVGFNIEKKLGLILGTQYGGEMEKAIFSLMNYWLPQDNVLTLHSSANKGKDDKTLLFIGSSGSGKTTLAADPNRCLIGDDEIGWNDDGIFNLEGGCYTKTYQLNKDKNPLIYKAIRERTILENVWVNPFGSVDFNITAKTDNGRASFPFYKVENFVRNGTGNHPSAIILLTCDSYGIFPLLSLLTPEQAIYHFLSGYSSKAIVNERGTKEIIPSFSPCYCDSFLLLHPTVYAKLLKKKIEKYSIPVYLINTGWIGGSSKTGKRIDIDKSRKCIETIVKDTILTSEYKDFDVFNFKIPADIPFVTPDIIDPRQTWNDNKEYDKARIELANKFIENYEKFKTEDEDLSLFGPNITQ